MLTIWGILLISIIAVALANRGTTPYVPYEPHRRPSGIDGSGDLDGGDGGGD